MVTSLCILVGGLMCVALPLAAWFIGNYVSSIERRIALTNERIDAVNMRFDAVNQNPYRTPPTSGLTPSPRPPKMEAM
jgi:hypothetical protein